MQKFACGASPIQSRTLVIVPLQRCSVHRAGKHTRPLALLHYIHKQSQTTQMIHLCNFEKTPAIAFIFSFTPWNDGWPCSPCRRDLCVTEVRSSNISWHIFSLHIYCFPSLCYFLLSGRRKYEIKWYGGQFWRIPGVCVSACMTVCVFLAPHSSLHCSFYSYLTYILGTIVILQMFFSNQMH